MTKEEFKEVMLGRWEKEGLPSVPHALLVALPPSEVEDLVKEGFLTERGTLYCVDGHQVATIGLRADEHLYKTTPCIRVGCSTEDFTDEDWEDPDFQNEVRWTYWLSDKYKTERGTPTQIVANKAAKEVEETLKFLLAAGDIKPSPEWAALVRRIRALGDQS